MQRVTGVGGVFITSKDPARPSARYAKHPGLQPDPAHGGVSLHWREDERADPEALLEALSAGGAAIDPKREDYGYGRFARIFDPDGSKIELWEPSK